VIPLTQYLHSNKAGNNGDVWKHIALYEILSHIKGIHPNGEYIETHAGAGIYHLYKNKGDQWRHGIGKILLSNGILTDHPSFKFINQFYKKGCYPGSAVIAQHILPNFIHRLYENNPEAATLLKSQLPGTSIINDNSWGYLSEHIYRYTSQPKLFFLDPPYKEDQDWENIASYTKLPENNHQNCFIVWYPIFSLDKINPFIEKKMSDNSIFFSIECINDTEIKGTQDSLIGSGMYIGNYFNLVLFNNLINLSKIIANLLSDGKSKTRIFSSLD
jgi:23S rRNA (adenine2030-N6)-methyltransferase